MLFKSECRSSETIADKLDICVTDAGLCIDKYNAGGIEAALRNNKGRGLKAEITDADIIRVISKTCQKPEEARLLISRCIMSLLYINSPMLCRKDVI